MTTPRTCYVCGSVDVVATRVGHSPTCARHKAAWAHIVSMQNEPATGDHLAVCPCGWTAQSPRNGMPGYQAIDAMVKAHWRQICGESE